MLFALASYFGENVIDGSMNPLMNLLIKSLKNGGIDWSAGPPVGEDLDLALVIGLPGY